MKVSPSIYLFYSYQKHRGRNVLLLYECYQGCDGKNYEWMCLDDEDIFPPYKWERGTMIILYWHWPVGEEEQKRKHFNPVTTVWLQSHPIKEAAGWTGAPCHTWVGGVSVWIPASVKGSPCRNSHDDQHKGALKHIKKIIYVTLIIPQLNSIKLVGLHETNTL